MILVALGDKYKICRTDLSVPARFCESAQYANAAALIAAFIRSIALDGICRQELLKNRLRLSVLIFTARSSSKLRIACIFLRAAGLEGGRKGDREAMTRR